MTRGPPRIDKSWPVSLLLASIVGGVLLGAGVKLEWSAPAACPGEAEVLADVERLLGERRLAAEVAVRAVITGDGEGHAATVTIDQAAARQLRARECAALARAIALVIAVAVDPVATREHLEILEPAPIEPAPIVPGPPPPVLAPVIVDPRPAPIAEPPPASPPRPRPRSEHAITIRGGLLIGVTPLATGAVALGYRLDRGLLRVEARALYGTPRRLDYPDGVGARLQSVTLGALACVAPERPGVRFPLCLGLEAGPLIGRAIAAEAPRLRADLWASGLVGAGLVARLGPRVALVVGAEFAVALRRPAFHVGAREVLARAPAVGVRALVGLEFFLTRP